MDAVLEGTRDNQSEYPLGRSRNSGLPAAVSPTVVRRSPCPVSCFLSSSPVVKTVLSFRRPFRYVAESPRVIGSARLGQECPETGKARLGFHSVRIGETPWASRSGQLCCPQIALKTGHETVRNRRSTANQRESLKPCCLGSCTANTAPVQSYRKRAD